MTSWLTFMVILQVFILKTSDYVIEICRRKEGGAGGRRNVASSVVR